MAHKLRVCGCMFPMQVDLFIARQMAAQNASLRNQLQGSGDVSSSALHDIDSSSDDEGGVSSGGDESDSEAKALAEAVRSESRRNLDKTLDEEVRNCFTPRAHVAASRQSRTHVGWLVVCVRLPSYGRRVTGTSSLQLQRATKSWSGRVNGASPALSSRSCTCS